MASPTPGMWTTLVPHLFGFTDAAWTLVQYSSSDLRSIVYLTQIYGVFGPLLFFFGNATIWRLQRRYLMSKKRDVQVAEKLRKMLQDESNVLSVSVRTPIARLYLCLPRLPPLSVSIGTSLTQY